MDSGGSNNNFYMKINPKFNEALHLQWYAVNMTNGCIESFDSMDEIIYYYSARLSLD